MITWSFILKRIKDDLGLPNQILEKEDEDIIQYLRDYAIKKFSHYFPAKGSLYLDTADPTYHVPNKQFEYYLVEPSSRTILNVTDIVPTLGERLVLGHPFFGPYSFNQVPQYLLQQMVAETTYLHSPYNYAFNFRAPNILTIRPKFNGGLTVEYDKELDPELSDIQPDIEDYFMDLCVAMTFMNIGRIRRKYSNYSTVFGEITLNAEEIYSEGENKFNALIDKFEAMSLTDVTFDRG